MSRVFGIFIFLSFFSCDLIAQDKLAYFDSLYEQAGMYKDEKRYKEAVDIYNQIEKSFTWMEIAENARKLHNNKGFVYYKLENYALSADNYQKSNLLAQELRDTLKIISSYKSLGLVYRILGFYSKSLENNQLALDFAKESNDSKNLIDLYNTTGLIYYDLDQFDKALASHREALSISLNLEDTVRTAALLNNIAMSHFSMGYYDSSLFYNRKAISLKFQQNIPKSEQISNLNNIGEDFLALDKLDSAKYYFLESHELSIRANNLQGIMSTSSNLAKLAIINKDYALAESYLDHIAKLLEQLDLVSLRTDYLELRVSVLEKQNKFAEALAYQKELTELRESIFQTEKLDVQRVESSYLLKEKDLEAQNYFQEAELAKVVSKRNSLVMLFLIGALLTAGFIVYLFVALNRRLRDSNKLIQAQKLDLKHSTYNTLMRVQALLRMTTDSLADPATQDKMKQLEAAIISAATLQQFTYGIENEEEVSLGKYLEELVERLKLVFNSSGNKNISYAVNVAEDTLLPVKTVLNCGLMVCEIVTNSVKYAFEDIPDPKINIKLIRLGSQMLIQVGDNGIGITTKPNMNSVGFGLIQKIAKYIKAELSVKNDQGTLYTIKLNG